jgi:capsular exopolysaccharide synthesis family protein
VPSRDAGIPDPTSPPQPPRRHAPGHAGPVAGRIGGAAAAPPSRDVVPPRPPALAPAPDLGALVKALKRRWLTAIGLGILLAGVLGSAAWMLLAPKYTAFAQVKVDAMREPVVPSKEEVAGDNHTAFTTYLKAQTTQLQSRFVLERALNRDEVKKLNLDYRYPSPVLWLEQELKVETQPDSEYIKLMLSCDDPDEARVILNAITEAYKKEVVDREESGRVENVGRLSKIYDSASQTLKQKRDELIRMMKQIQSPDLETFKIKHETMLRALAEAQSRHSQISFDLTRAQGHLKALEAQQAGQDKATVSEATVNEAVESDPALKLDLDRIKRIEELMTEMRISMRYWPREPRYLEAQKRLQLVKGQVDSRRQELRKEMAGRVRQKTRADNDARKGALDAEVAALMPQEESYRKRALKLEKETQQVGEKTAQYEALKADIASSSTIVDEVGRKLRFAEFELNARPRITIAQEAALMARDVKKQVLGSVFAVIVALAGGCFGVAWWEFRRRRVRSPEEVSTGLGIRVVGAVPASPDVEAIINAPPEEELDGHLVLESIDAIRTLVLNSARQDATRVLMVTSAESGEGKTTLASHLAGSLSRAGRKTLLIDGDLRQPAVHQFFEAPMEPGLSEVLLGEVDTVDAIQKTNQDGLLVMPAGQWDREVLQSLARGEASDVLEKLKEEFDFIVIDSHPVLAATDSLLIGEAVDAVILSVLRDVSRTPRVYAASQQLQGLGIRVLGAVVNATDPAEVYVAGHAYAAA